MREFMAVARFGGRLYWRDKVALSTSVALSLGLGIGLPYLMAKVRPGAPGVLLDSHLGLLAMIMTIAAVMQTAVTLTARRDQLILKRMRATGLNDREIIGGEIGNIAAQTALLALVVTIVLYVVAGLQTPRQPLVLVAFVVVGAAVLSLLGAAWTVVISRSELAAVITMPWFMLAGLGAGGFGPVVELLPSWVGTVLNLLPTGGIVEGARFAYTGQGNLPFALLNLAVWTAIGLVVIRHRFRWEPRKS
ncbi:ABC transporter permease [Nonomuraea africana]|uniref:ABC-2 type transport system permease protein n=1 Tax=Nonomuraea africana TaxID=46171 RepID=A0ABR9KIS5_9ACTN|nr:ABC transporter permease [Nonomuraea africana]MBE1561705.1 ABC-2 type transport system permease protein [Nonomuraea africana]